MALSVAFIIGLLAVAVFCVTAGHYSKRIELYFLGVFVLFFVGLGLVTQGYSVESGYVLDRNETSSGHGCSSNCTFVDEVSLITRQDVKDSWSNAFGLLFVVAAAGLSLTYFQDRNRKRLEKERSVELEDDF